MLFRKLKILVQVLEIYEVLEFKTKWHFETMQVVETFQ